MGTLTERAVSRRGLIKAGSLLSMGLAVPKAFASVAAQPKITGVKPELVSRAFAAMQKHQRSGVPTSVFAIADFDEPSNKPRFHVIDMIAGKTRSYLVSHGRGSDPDHSGWLRRFSNQEGSYASSSGTYLTSELYVGKHGKSRRLVGLDPSNSNAEPRAIVIHSAWYVSDEMVRQHGKLGRSEGCFALDKACLDEALTVLGPNRFIYADKI